MGLREVRRLRGETGRAMFFDDLENECFAPLFGERTQKSTDADPSPELASKGFRPAENLVNPTRRRFASGDFLSPTPEELKEAWGGYFG